MTAGATLQEATTMSHTWLAWLAAAGLLACTLTASAQQAVQYRYDDLGRIVSVTYANGSQMTYQYDAAGNRTQHAVTAGGNRAPAAVDDTKTTSINTPLTFDPRTNDGDPDGNAITVTAKSDGAKGSVSVGGGGTSLTYTPQAGQTGADTFTYVISDPSNATSTATVHMTISGGNQPPVATHDTQSTALNTPLTFDPRTNDSDPNGDPIAITAKTNGAKGTVSIGGSGTTLTYTPGTDQTGNDTFTYTISDPSNASATGSVVMAISSGNGSPIAEADATIAVPTVPVTVNVRGNDSDPDDDVLTITTVATPTKGAAQISNGNIVYTANSGTSGTDSFSYTISDGNGGTANASVSVTINRLPIAVADSATASPSIAATISVRNNDSDPDGDALTVTSTTTPTKGVSNISNNNVAYTANSGTSGTDSFNYTVTDTKGGSASAIVTITISGNQPPVANDDSIGVDNSGGYTFTFNPRVNDTDANGHALTITSKTNGEKGTVTILGGGTSLNYTLSGQAPPVYGFDSDSFSYTISDGNGGTDTATVYVEIQTTCPPYPPGMEYCEIQ